jgi:hypothetical protein
MRCHVCDSEMTGTRVVLPLACDFDFQIRASSDLPVLESSGSSYCNQDFLQSQAGAHVASRDVDHAGNNSPCNAAVGHCQSQMRQIKASRSKSPSYNSMRHATASDGGLRISASVSSVDFGIGGTTYQDVSCFALVILFLYYGISDALIFFCKF